MVSFDMDGLSFKVLLTVDGITPALLATSLIVAIISLSFS
ncbi:protein of unknown function [Streptococcus thermophilus]|nr:protein of unknown function [Streptococcus thermophilus]CAD0150046.1 protein of unknown function [Streptococcus thermophilus]